jgi:probable rRNA maturation factor
VQDELHLLTVHGVLHLLGYDHAEPDQEREMFRLQNELLDTWRELRAAQARKVRLAAADAAVLDTVGLAGPNDSETSGRS